MSRDHWLLDNVERCEEERASLVEHMRSVMDEDAGIPTRGVFRQDPLGWLLYRVIELRLRVEQLESKRDSR